MKLLLDAMLGKLARYLRMCGHDAAYALDRGFESDDAIQAAAEAEDRVLVTRDVELATAAEDAILVESKDIDGQLREVARAGVRLSLADPTRCGRCNSPLERVADDEQTPAYAPDPAEGAVWRCVDCGQCFWRGSHWDDVEERLARLDE